MIGVHGRGTARLFDPQPLIEAEVAAGFLGGDFYATRSPCRHPWRAGLPGCGRHPFEADEAAHVVDEVRHSDFAPRADDADEAGIPPDHRRDCRAPAPPAP
jgi:hypothetical protein